MSIDLNGLVEKKLKAIDQEMRYRAPKAMRALRSAVTDKVMKGQRGGNTTGRSYRSTSCTASAPGEPPAVRSGNLRGSLVDGVSSESSKFLTVTIKTETGVKYAGYLEHGTKKMAARPYVERIKQEALPEIEQIYGEPYNV